MDLEGCTAVVTGAGRGLGRVVALSLAGAGARVAAISLDTPNLAGLREELHAMGRPAAVVPADVADPRSVAEAALRIGEQLGPVDALVNNAAVIGPPRFLEDADPETWSRTLAVNLTGPFLCARAFLPAMQRRGRGAIVNLVSGLGQMPFPRFCAYAVSKAGVIQLTRSLSSELAATGVRVNAVDPGVMDTDMQAEIRALGAEVLGTQVYRDFVAMKEGGDLRDPGEVAALVVWLCSSAAAALNGLVGTLADYRRRGWRG